MLKRTPAIALILAGFLAAAVLFIFELPERPFSTGQIVVLYFLSFLVTMGVALLFDPNAKKAREDYLKINFYAEEE